MQRTTATRCVVCAISGESLVPRLTWQRAGLAALGGLFDNLFAVREMTYEGSARAALRGGFLHPVWNPLCQPCLIPPPALWQHFCGPSLSVCPSDFDESCENQFLDSGNFGTLGVKLTLVGRKVRFPVEHPIAVLSNVQQILAFGQ